MNTTQPPSPQRTRTPRPRSLELDALTLKAELRLAECEKYLASLRLALQHINDAREQRRIRRLLRAPV